jgi:hypothetical protein
VVLTGKREPPGLWKTLDSTKLNVSNPWQANGAYTTQLRSNAIKFMHAACFSPTTETWTKAIDAGAFQSWDGLTSKAVRQLLPKSMATAMGHLVQQRKNVRSTKQPTTSATTTARTSKLQTILEEDEENEGWITVCKKQTKPTGATPQDSTMIPNLDFKVNQKDQCLPMEDPTSTAFASIIEFNETQGRSYSDLTGRFPCKSN